MDAIECLKTRRSTRVYLETPVPQETVWDIIDCARLSPTGQGQEPWAFVVVRDAATRASMAAVTDFGKFITQTPVCIAVFCRDTMYFLEEGSAATTTLLLAAHAHGFRSCWIAGDKTVYASEMRALLGAPDRLRLISLVTIGYSSEFPGKRRRDPQDVVHWEQFGSGEAVAFSRRSFRRSRSRSRSRPCAGRRSGGRTPSTSTRARTAARCR